MKTFFSSANNLTHMLGAFLLLVTSHQVEANYARFASRLNDDYCLDLAGSGTNNGNKVVLWRCHGGDNQLWMKDDKGYIRSKVNPNKCIDPRGPSTANGTPLQIWDCEDDYIPQKWTHGSNGGAIRSQWDSHKCIDIRRAEAKNGADIIVWDCHGGSNQLFDFNIVITGGGVSGTNLNACEVLRLELIAGCLGMLPNIFAYAGCMAAAATAWHICFETTDRRSLLRGDSDKKREDVVEEQDNSAIPGCGPECMAILKDVNVPEEVSNYTFEGLIDGDMEEAFENGKAFGELLVKETVRD